VTRLSILEVIEDTHIGGAQKVCVDLSRCLAGRGHRVTVAIAGEVGPLSDGLTATGVESVSFGERPRKFHFSLSRAVRGLVCGHDVDVVHSHMFVPNTWAGFAARRERRVAFVPTEHSPGAWKRRLHCFADQLTYRRADAVVCVSESVAEAVAASHRRASRKLQVIENGVDVPPAVTPEMRRAARSALDVDENAFVIAAVGRLTWEKDHASLIHAARLLRRRAPDLVVLIVGSGPLEDELAERIRASDTSKTVRLLGTRTDVNRILAAADVFCQASLSEGSPVALLEAMAAGLPAVVSNIPALASKVRHEGTGFVVPTRRPDALAQAFEKLLRVRAVRLQLGLRAREHVSARYTLEQTADHYEELFMRLAEARRSGE